MTAITEYGHGAPNAFRNANRRGTHVRVDFRGVLAGMEAWLAQCFEAAVRMRHRQLQRRRLLEQIAGPRTCDHTAAYRAPVDGSKS
jgi:hypothetical protein